MLVNHYYAQNYASIMWTTLVVIPFFFLFSLSFSEAIGLQNCHSCAMSFLLLINFFSVPHFAMTVFMCICLHKQRKMSFEFSSILSTVDLD